jgi:hypothetical protein
MFTQSAPILYRRISVCQSNSPKNKELLLVEETELDYGESIEAGFESLEQRNSGSDKLASGSNIATQ